AHRTQVQRDGAGGVGQEQLHGVLALGELEALGGRGRNAPVARLTRPDLALLAIGPDEAQYGLVRQIGAAVVIEGDAGAHHRAVDARVLDHARALPTSDQPGERVDLGGEALGEEEGHRLGAFTTRHTTMPTTHATARKDRPASAKKVASRAVIVRPV